MLEDYMLYHASLALLQGNVRTIIQRVLGFKDLNQLLPYQYISCFLNTNYYYITAIWYAEKNKQKQLQHINYGSTYYNYFKWYNRQTMKPQCNENNVTVWQLERHLSSFVFSFAPCKIVHTNH